MRKFVGMKLLPFLFAIAYIAAHGDLTEAIEATIIGGLILAIIIALSKKIRTFLAQVWRRFRGKEEIAKPPFAAILGIHPLTIAGFRAPKDRIGVKIENGDRPLVIYDLWLKDSDGQESRSITMRNLHSQPLRLAPHEHSDPPLHFSPLNPWLPDEPVTICIQEDGQVGRVWEFETVLPPIPR